MRLKGAAMTAKLDWRMTVQVISALCMYSACVCPAYSQCAAGAQYQQSEAVKQRYPDPPVRFTTPAFEPGKTGFTSHEEMMAFLESLSKRNRVNLREPRCYVVGGPPGTFVHGSPSLACSHTTVRKGI
ncbi:MAG: hypothetical protein ACXWI6_17060 [Burkholderiales bacterium]